MNTWECLSFKRLKQTSCVIIISPFHNRFNDYCHAHCTVCIHLLYCSISQQVFYTRIFLIFNKNTLLNLSMKAHSWPQEVKRSQLFYFQRELGEHPVLMCQPKAAWRSWACPLSAPVESPRPDEPPAARGKQWLRVRTAVPIGQQHMTTSPCMIFIEGIQLCGAAPATTCLPTEYLPHIVTLFTFDGLWTAKNSVVNMQKLYF